MPLGYIRVLEAVKGGLKVIIKKPESIKRRLKIIIEGMKTVKGGSGY